MSLTNTRQLALALGLMTAAVLGVGTAHGQDDAGYRIEVEIDGHEDSLVFLGNYFMDKQYLVDTAEVVGGKAYLTAAAKIHPAYADSLRLLIDTGASLAMLMHADRADSLLYPPNLVIGQIGYGLGGSLYGYVGRSDTLGLGPFHLPDVVTHFQSLESDSLRGELVARRGIIGNRLLDRFLVRIDYPRSMLYLQPTRRYRRRRPYDRSGLRFVSDGAALTHLRVQLVTAGSPADVAGVRVGDRITHVNGVPVRLTGLEGVKRRLRRKPGKKVKLAIVRAGGDVTVSFRLRELI